jgi:hypothetical protein
VKLRLALVAAMAVSLALPVAAAGHPSNATNSFMYGLGGATASLTQPVDDGGAQFTKTENMKLKSFTPRPPGTPNVFGDFISDLAFWGDTVYQGTFDGFRIIDVDDVSDPTVLVDFDDCANANGAGQGDVVVCTCSTSATPGTRSSSPPST